MLVRGRHAMPRAGQDTVQDSKPFQDENESKSMHAPSPQSGATPAERPGRPGRWIVCSLRIALLTLMVHRLSLSLLRCDPATPPFLDSYPRPCAGRMGSTWPLGTNGLHSPSNMTFGCARGRWTCSPKRNAGMWDPARKRGRGESSVWVQWSGAVLCHDTDDDIIRESY